MARRLGQGEVAAEGEQAHGAQRVPEGSGGGSSPLGGQHLVGAGALMPRGACGGSELRGGGGRWGPGRGLASAGLEGALAPVGPPSCRVWPRWLLCSCGTQRGGWVSSPPQPALASVPGSACPNVHLSASAIECPPAAQLSSENWDSTFKQRNGSESFRICRLYRGKSDTPWDVCGGGKAGSWGHSFVHQSR